MSEDISLTINKKKLTVQRWILGALGALIVFLVSWAGRSIVMAGDQHNDSRYVSIAEYAKDRANDIALRTQESEALRRELDGHGEALRSIQADVKSILFEIPNKIDNLERRYKAHGETSVTPQEETAAK